MRLSLSSAGLTGLYAGKSPDAAACSRLRADRSSLYPCFPALRGANGVRVNRVLCRMSDTHFRHMSGANMHLCHMPGLVQMHHMLSRSLDMERMSLCVLSNLMLCCSMMHRLMVSGFMMRCPVVRRVMVRGVSYHSSVPAMRRRRTTRARSTSAGSGRVVSQDS